MKCRRCNGRGWETVKLPPLIRTGNGVELTISTWIDQPCGGCRNKRLRAEAQRAIEEWIERWRRPDGGRAAGRPGR